MVRQHHAAGADPHVFRHGRDLADHDLGRRARDRGQVVMLRDPIARVAEPVGELRKIERVAQRNCAGGAGHDRREIENGEGDHWGGTAPVQQTKGSGKVSSGRQKTTPEKLGAADRDLYSCPVRRAHGRQSEAGRRRHLTGGRRRCDGSAQRVIRIMRREQAHHDHDQVCKRSLALALDRAM
jgi:hypothetical protein